MYVYPASLNQFENRLKIKVQDRCDLNIKILRLWINDEYSVQNTLVSSMMDKELGVFTVVLVNNTYYLPKVTTERGNVFTSASGSLYYINGYWVTPEPSICINIENDQGQYRIYVENSTIGFFYQWETDGIVHYDLIKSVAVIGSTIYQVTILKKLSSVWVPIAGSPTYVSVDYPAGPPVVFVFADGKQLK